MKFTNLITWMLRLLAALILLQTLYFKFTGHPQSVHLFTQLGMEPWGRIGIGALELIAAILILYPRTTGIGAAPSFFILPFLVSYMMEMPGYSYMPSLHSFVVRHCWQFIDGSC